MKLRPFLRDGTLRGDAAYREALSGTFVAEHSDSTQPQQPDVQLIPGLIRLTAVAFAIGALFCAFLAFHVGMPG